MRFPLHELFHPALKFIRKLTPIVGTILKLLTACLVNNGYILIGPFVSHVSFFYCISPVFSVLPRLFFSLWISFA